MFNAMMDAIKEESVGFIFNLEVEVEIEMDDGEGDDEVAVDDDVDGEVRVEQAAHEEAPNIRAKGLAPAPPQQLTYTAPSEDGEAETSTEPQRQPAASGQAPAGARRPQRGNKSSASRNKSRKRR
jgi:preprotein translocase subunit SecA